jgi:hypothetical protein
VQKEYAMRAVAAPIRFAGSQLAEARHVCAFFNSDDEEYRVLLPFIKDGFEWAIRRFMSSIRINVTLICNGWLR